MLHDFSKDHFDVFILAGQSNAEGFAYGFVEKPFTPTDKIWYLESNDTITMARELVVENGIRSNLSLSFAEEYVRNGKLVEGRKVLILRAAVGGTSFSDHRWNPEDDLFMKMKDMIFTAKKLNPKNRFKAILWHQGETDATRGEPADLHQARVMKLAELVRDFCEEPRLPFIAGDFVPIWKRINGKNWNPFHKPLDSNQECFDKRYFEGWRDIVHFCRPSIQELGVRYWKAYERLSEKSK